MNRIAGLESGHSLPAAALDLGARLGGGEPVDPVRNRAEGGSLWRRTRRRPAVPLDSPRDRIGPGRVERRHPRMFLLVCTVDLLGPLTQRNAKAFRQLDAPRDGVTVHERDGRVGRQVVGLQQNGNWPHLAGWEREPLDDRARLIERHEAPNRIKRAGGDEREIVQRAGRNPDGLCHRFSYPSIP